jgi:hypothetical protein
LDNPLGYSQHYVEVFWTIIEFISNVECLKIF